MEICWPEKAQEWCTPEKTKIYLAFISIFCLLFNLPTFFELEWGAEGVKWTDLLSSGNYFLIYNVSLRLIIRCALPIICLVTLSSLVVIKVTSSLMSRAQFYIQLVFTAPLSITLRIKIWVVAYFDPKKNSSQMFLNFCLTSLGWFKFVPVLSNW